MEVTDDSRASWWRGEVAQVLEPSTDRVVPPCPVAGLCGGCDWQHVALPRQRALKADLIAEQMLRLAHLDAAVTVEAVPGDDDGLAWRTRMRYLANAGEVGLRGALSHDLVALPPSGCLLAAPGGPGVSELSALAAGLPDQAEICVTVAEGATVWSPGRGVLAGEEVVTQHALGRDYAVRADGFWQVHPGAAAALSKAVLAALEPQPGERALDIYCGVGLFAGALATAGAEVFGVERNRAAIALARRNVPEARFSAARAEGPAWLSMAKWKQAELVVLDPPRAGAGEAVVNRVVAARPRAVAYVACDEAALARDAAAFARLGYAMTSLWAFDIFPMTSHVECVARFEML